ncbi:cyanase [Microbacterium sp. LMC-P-041]|uniref:cyanase n=1 Tax=Microbacterium sp. LMC-P-041 TaxID=3040293 RepID=UPI002556696F|nr:cyanase [Microbacterium sp. LMC-P-041]
MISKEDAGDIIDEHRRRKRMSWRDLARRLGQPPVWTAAAALGMHPVPAREARQLKDALELEDEIVDALVRQPTRSPSRDTSDDPTIYRFHELIQVYGPALKSLIHDEFGDGIMSAINCSITLERAVHPDGDRVVVTIDGKFLPYAWTSSVQERPQSTAAE